MKDKTNFYGTSLYDEAGMRIERESISKNSHRVKSLVSKVIILLACIVSTALQVNAQDDGEYLNWTGTREVKFQYLHQYTNSAYICVESSYLDLLRITLYNTEEASVFNMESVGDNSFRLWKPSAYEYGLQFVKYWVYHDGNIEKNNPELTGSIILCETVKDDIGPIKDLSIFKFKKYINENLNISDTYFIETQTGDTITVDPSSGRLAVTHDISDELLSRSLFQIVDLNTSNEDITDRNDIKIYASGKELRIEASSKGIATVYNLLGGIVRNVVYSEGLTSVSLPAGIYIVKAGTTVAKVIF